MSGSKRAKKQESWVVLLFIALVAYALIAGWWKEHSIIGWIIVGVLLALLAYLVYRFPQFRGWLKQTVKALTEKAMSRDVHQIEAEEKQDSVSIKAAILSETEKAKLINAVGNQCENPRCRHEHYLDVHHIRPRAEGGGNNRRNLIVLCPNCHRVAQRGAYSRALLKEWISRPRRFKFNFDWQYK